MNQHEPEDSATGVANARPPRAARPSSWLTQAGAGILILFAKAKFLLIYAWKIVPFFLSLGFYSLLFGWRFGLLFLLLIAIHELGHYMVMRYFGMDASFPMFIPGLGAMIFTKSLTRASALQKAIVGYAGPLAGTLAAAVFAAYGFASASPLWVAAAYSGFFLNAFNLFPTPPFDGSHIIQIISDKLWSVGLGLFLVACWYMPSLRNPLVILIVVLSIPRVVAAWRGPSPGEFVPVPQSLQIRCAFALAYFGLIGLDLAGMLLTHLQVRQHIS